MTSWDEKVPDFNSTTTRAMTASRGIGKTVHSADQTAFCALMIVARRAAGLTDSQ